MAISTIKRTMKDVMVHGIANVKELMGAGPKFCIRGAYQHRTEVSYFNDTGQTDEYQKEVYLRAAALAWSEKIETVYDIGCGSGYKLVRYLGQYDTMGFDVPQTVEFLRQAHPDRKWTIASFSDRSHPPADLVICADVIEHVLDPDQLMLFLVSVTRKWLVLSTPDRRRCYSPLSRFQLGPPHTDHHVREWTFAEFGRYVGQFVDVCEHVHPNQSHANANDSR
jgi:hypothetical protein